MNDSENRTVIYVYIEEKNAIVLTTIQDNVKITKEKWKNSQVHTMYDHTNGGVDVADLLSTSHSTKIKSTRPALNALVLIQNTCKSDAKTILGDSILKFNDFEFTYNLGKALVLPLIEK